MIYEQYTVTTLENSIYKLVTELTEIWDDKFSLKLIHHELLAYSLI